MNQLLAGCWTFLTLAAFFAAGTFAISVTFGRPYSLMTDATDFWRSIGWPAQFVVILLAGLYLVAGLRRPVGQNPGADHVPIPRKGSRVLQGVFFFCWLVGSIIGLLAGGVFMFQVFQAMQE